MQKRKYKHTPKWFKKKMLQELMRLFDAQDTSEGRVFSWDYDCENFVRVAL